jgi:hypothetical protein
MNEICPLANNDAIERLTPRVALMSPGGGIFAGAGMLGFGVRCGGTLRLTIGYACGLASSGRALVTLAAFAKIWANTKGRLGCP